MKKIDDITEIKRIDDKLGERHQFLKNVFNAIQDGISVLDRDLNIILVNQWMEKMYSSEKPLINRKCYEVYQKRKTSCPWCPSLPAIEQGVLKVSVVPYPTKDNPTGWIELTAFPLKNNEGHIIGVIEHVKDITEWKKAEQKLKKALNTTEFYKDLLVHDMGNILNNIKTSTELMEMWKVDPTKEDKKERLMEIIKQSIERGASLLSNVRKLSKIEGEEQVITSVDVKITLKNAIEYIRSRFQEKEIEIKNEMPQVSFNVKGGDLLIDAFENLLINGAIHNHSDNIQLGIKINKVQEVGKKLIKIEFEDNGIGIIKERKKVIFDRDHKKDKSTGGMGIGLSLVKKIIDGYNGQVWVENRVEGDHEQGSNFIVLLEEA